MKTLLRYAAVLAVTMLAACSQGGAGGSANPSPTTMSDAEVLAIGKEVAQCFRDNGVPTLPDPIVENGRLELPGGVEAQMENQYSQQVLQRAQEACQSVMDRLPQSAIGADEGGARDAGGSDDRQVPGPEDVDALRRFAQCMRDNGVPEWPDPKADGSFPLMGTPLETEGKSPRVIAGFQACEQHWSGSGAEASMFRSPFTILCRALSHRRRTHSGSASPSTAA